LHERHLAAARRHEAAALSHERSAKFWDERGDGERASLQRELADHERCGAELERRWAALASQETDGARAVQAHAERAVLSSGDVRRQRECSHTETNVAYVARLWEAFRTGGVDAIAPLIPDDVEWMPLQAGGRVLHGTGELRAFWGTRPLTLAPVEMFRGESDDVIVHAEPPSETGEQQPCWSLYRFEGRRLLAAQSFADRDSAFRDSRTG